MLYGPFGGISTILHTIVRAPVLVLCAGVGGVSYYAVTCLPTDPKPAPAVIHQITPPPKVDNKNLPPPIMYKKIRGELGLNTQKLVDEK